MKQQTTSFVLLLIFLPVISLSPVELLPASTLFQNTLKRWEVKIANDVDKSERWTRFLESKRSVEKFTTGASLDSLNIFTVMNDAEYEESMEKFKYRGLNISVLEERSEKQVGDESLLLSQRADIPTSFDYWEKTVGFHPAQDQGSCGSCWAFAGVAAMEIVYKKLTGDFVKFSEQYFVDCIGGNGCVGGHPKDVYKTTIERQYLMYEKDLPTTGTHKPCEILDDISSFTNNAMKKTWFTNMVGTSISEKGFLERLQWSPVAFGSLISKGDFSRYSGGIWTDYNCYNEPQPHVMLLVGYTEEYLRVRNSWGTGWGESGYGNYARHTITLGRCSFYKTGFVFEMIPRKEMEYEFCNDKKLSTRKECKDSCEKMNTETETGWTLAVIPSAYHNQLIVDMVNNDLWPGVKSDKKLKKTRKYQESNYLWIGLTNIKNAGWIGDWEWANGLAISYYNKQESIGKYGVINRDSGLWGFKNNLKYTIRGLCSRTKTCWNIENAVENGQVTFDRDEITEGSTASVTCDGSYTVTGASTMTCVGGNWDPELPTCA